MRPHRTWLLLLTLIALLAAGPHAGGTAAEGERLTVEAIFGEDPVTG